jgi:sulfoxide reductase heme-binding subunit YedZ
MRLLAEIDVAGLQVVDQIWWFTSRAAGIVAWVLLSLSVIVGLTMSTRSARRLPAGWPLDLHRYLSMLSLTFLTVHLVALIPDDFVHFGLAELLVPMASEWQPGSVAWGIVAFWLVVAVQVTSLLRRRLPTKVWRVVHMSSFVVWLSATVHLLYAGTDAEHPIFRGVQVLTIATVVVLFGRRILFARLKHVRSGGRAALPVEEAVDVDQIDAGEGRKLPA